MNLYTHSYLFFGLNEATYRVHAAVASNSSNRNPDGTWNHPCYNSGWIETWTSPQNVTYRFAGTSNPAACTTLTTALLTQNAPCWTPAQCAISGVYQPAVTGQFVGFSAFASVFNSSLLPPTTTLAQLSSAQASLCALTYSQLVAQYPSKYRATLCIGLSYFYPLLTQGYGFNPAAPSGSATVRIADSINDYDLGWALGGILYNANGMGWQLPSQDCGGLSKSSAVTLAVVLSTLLLATTIGCVVMWFKYNSLSHLHESTTGLIDNQAP